MDTTASKPSAGLQALLGGFVGYSIADRIGPAVHGKTIYERSVELTWSYILGGLVVGALIGYACALLSAPRRDDDETPGDSSDD